MIELTVVCALQLLVIVWLLVDRRVERRENTRERADLCQRLQAPEAAVIAHQVQAMPASPVPAMIDDDEGFWESREDLAAALQRLDRDRP